MAVDNDTVSASCVWRRCGLRLGRPRYRPGPLTGGKFNPYAGRALGIPGISGQVGVGVNHELDAVEVRRAKLPLKGP